MFSNFGELYKFRALIWGLVVRHLSIRYRGSVLGFLWSFLNPLCLMLVYLLVFRYYVRFDQVNNYTIFLFCGLLPWIWFSSGLVEGSSAIASGGHLITKSMFPAHVLPTVAVITSMINFLLALPILFILMWAMSVPFHWTLLLVPLIVVVQFFFLYGLTMFFGALNVYFRDTQHILSNSLTLLFFLCPIVYSPETVPDRFKFTLELNPIALITMSYHELILKGTLPGTNSVIYLLAFVFLSVILGNIVYNRYRESFAEML